MDTPARELHLALGRIDGGGGFDQRASHLPGLSRRHARGDGAFSLAERD